MEERLRPKAATGSGATFTVNLPEKAVQSLKTIAKAAMNRSMAARSSSRLSGWLEC